MADASDPIDLQIDPARAADATDDAAAKDAAEEEEFVLTPEVLQSENRRIDLLYISTWVLALGLLLGIYVDRGADLPLTLATGRLVSDTFPSFPRTAIGTYTAEQAPWTIPYWLFDVTVYQLFDKLGGWAVTLVKPVVAMLLAAMLLCCRHRGPTLWWAGICTALGLVALAWQVKVEAQLLALLYLAATLALWTGARYGGRSWVMYLLIPLAVLWVNTAPLAFLGPLVFLILAAGEAVGDALPRSLRFGREVTAGQRRTLFLVAGGGFLATLAHPYFLGGVAFPFDWHGRVLPAVPDFEKLPGDWLPLTDLYIRRFDALLDLDALPSEYALVVLAIFAVASFPLNARHFSVGRVLLTVLALALPLLAYRYAGFSAVLLAYVLSMNGQELFQRSFGTEPRLEGVWVPFSQFGRFATLIVLTVAVFLGLTGRLQPQVRQKIGLGVDFALGMRGGAEWLRQHPPEGKVFAFTTDQADFLLWDSTLANFVDDRWQLYPEIFPLYSVTRLSLVGELKAEDLTSPVVKEALARIGVEDLPSEPTELASLWKAVFDHYGITAVVVNPRVMQSRDSMQRFVTREEFTPVYLDGGAMILGRIDIDNPDRPLWTESVIDPERLVFRDGLGDAPEPQRPPMGRDLLSSVYPDQDTEPDGYYAGVTLMLPRVYPRISAGKHLLAVRRFREALAEDPDSGPTYAVLAATYLDLYELEEAFSLQIMQNRMLQRAAEAREQAAAAEQAPPNPDQPTGAPTPADQPVPPQPAEPKPADVEQEQPRPEQPQEKMPAPAGDPTDDAAAAARPVALFGQDEEAVSAAGAPASGPAPASAVATPDPSAPGDRAAAPPGFTPQLELTPENALALQWLNLAVPQMRPPTAQNSLLRHHGIMAAFQYAFAAGVDNYRVHLQFSGVCLGNSYLDLALQHFDAAYDQLQARADTGQLNADALVPLRQHQERLRSQVDRQRELFDTEVARSKELMQQAGQVLDAPGREAQLASSLGLVALAQEKLDGMDEFSPDYPATAPFATRFWLLLGYPEKAQDWLRDVPATGPGGDVLEAGERSFFVSQIRYMLGDYAQAKESLERALADVRVEAVRENVTGLAGRIIYGRHVTRRPDGSVASVFGEAGELDASIKREVQFLYYLGLLRIEMGEPEVALGEFARAMELEPANPFRATMEFYWSRISDEPPPAEPPARTEDDFIARRFEEAATPAGEPKPEADPTSENAAKPEPADQP